MASRDLADAPENDFLFRDRQEAGELLGRALIGYRTRCPILISLTDGGAVVAREIASFLEADFLPESLVRFLPVPGHPPQESLQFPVELNGRTVILVDDGEQAGTTLPLVAERILERYPARLVLAVPVLWDVYQEKLEQIVDEVQTLLTTHWHRSLDEIFEHFEHDVQLESSESVSHGVGAGEKIQNTHRPL